MGEHYTSGALRGLQVRLRDHGAITQGQMYRLCREHAEKAERIAELKAQRDALLEAADALIRFLGEEGYATDDRGLPDPYDEIEAMVRCIAQAHGEVDGG